MTNLLNSTINSVQPPATLAMNVLAGQLKRQGREIIDLSVGSPDIPTPEHIRAAGLKAIREGRTDYTASDGMLELKEAVAHKFLRDNNLRYAPDEINVSSGAKHVIYNAFATTLSRGEKVAIQAPYWVSYPAIAQLCGASPVIMPTALESGWKLSPETLERHLDARTKWLVLNSPCNPTGAVYTRDELLKLSEVIRKFPNLLVLSDDIYEHIIFDGAEFVTLAQVAPDLKQRILTVNGASKSYSMTGWRIGFAGGPAWLISAMRTFMMQTSHNPCTISQWAAVEALTGDQSFLDKNRLEYKRRRDAMNAIIREVEGLSCEPPLGSFYLFLDISRLLGRKTPLAERIDSDDDFSRLLLSQYGVAVLPGSAFGQPGALRISFAQPLEAVESGIQKLGKFCADLS